MTRRGKHVSPRARGRETRLVGRAVPLALALVMVMTAVAWADSLELADGDKLTDIGNKTFSINKVTGESFTVKGHLWLKKNKPGTTVDPSTEFTASGFTQGACGSSMTGTNADFETPSGWADADNGDLLGPIEVTISGTAGTVGTYSCIFRYQTLPNIGVSPRQEDFTFNFNISPAVTNTVPLVAFTDGPTEVNESSTTEHTFTFSITDPDDDTWSFATDYPKCGSGGELVASSATINQGAKTGEFKCVFDDGLDPAVASTVAVKVNDGTVDSNEATRSVTVANVAPTVNSFTPVTSNILTGATVNFNATATDPSAADTAAGFQWGFDPGTGTFGSYGSAITTPFTPSHTYDSCGTFTARVQAKDKDEGESTAASAVVNVYDGAYLNPLKPGQTNVVQAGRVVPVQINFGCNGHLSGLEPHIRLFSGNISGEGDPGDETLVTESVSNADSGTTMREVDSKYMYNLQIPKNAASGQEYTIRVRPFGPGTQPVMDIVIKVR